MADSDSKKNTRFGVNAKKIRQNISEITTRVGNVALNSELTQSLIEKKKEVESTVREYIEEQEERELSEAVVHQDKMLSTYEIYSSKLSEIITNVEGSEKYINSIISSPNNENKLLELIRNVEAHENEYKKLLDGLKEDVSSLTDIKKKSEENSKIIRHVKEEAVDTLSEIKSNYGDLKYRVLKLEESSKNIGKNYKDFASVISRIKKIEEAAKAEADEQKEKLQKSLNNIEHAFKAKLKTDTAVKFWEEKSISHKKREKILVLTIIFFIIISVISLVSIISIFKNLNLTVSEMQLWPIVAIGSLSLFMVWIARLLVKLYISQVNLQEDANERVIIANTFIGFLKDSVVSKDEMGIVLKSLFRATPKIGEAGDSVPNLPIEIISRVLTNKEKT